MDRIFFLVFALFSLSGPLFSHGTPLHLPSQGEKLTIQNRILARVNDQTITVIDVMEKMNLYLKKNYPAEADSPLTRTRFFMTNWKEVLNQMIDQELIVADSTYMELKISDKDIRERLLTKFGTNFMTVVDQAGISYTKAKEMMRKEIAVERMTMFRVHTKAFQRVGPQEIKRAYKEYCHRNPATEEWSYYVVSIRSKQDELAKTAAQKSFTLLSTGEASLTTLNEELKKHLDREEHVSIHISDLYTANVAKISEQHKTVLASLPCHVYSEPVCQKSRFDNSTIYRIFLLENYTVKNPPPFDSMIDTLNNELMEHAVAKETEIYVNKLRKRFGFEETSLLAELPEDFEPFSMN